MTSVSRRSPANLRSQLDNGFGNYENCLSHDPVVIDNLTDDCRVAFTALSSNDDSESASDKDEMLSISSKQYHNRGSTYFQRSDLPGRCSLEVLALSIFRFHTKNAHFDPHLSGAEWWTQVVDSDNDIGFHWDRDYGQEQSTGENIYPHLATVTYLTDKGGPTVILNKKGCSTSEANHSGSADIVIISTPLLGKHIKFDGRLLHAAPSNLILKRKTETVKSTRITFLSCSVLSHFGDSVCNLMERSVPPNTSCRHRKHSQSERLLPNSKSINMSSMCASLPSISMSAEILLGTLDLHRWRFVNGGQKYLVSIPLSSSERLTSLLRDRSSISLTYSGSGVCPTIESLEKNCDTLDESLLMRKRRRKFWRPFHLSLI